MLEIFVGGSKTYVWLQRTQAQTGFTLPIGRKKTFTRDGWFTRTPQEISSGWKTSVWKSSWPPKQNRSKSITWRSPLDTMVHLWLLKLTTPQAQMTKNGLSKPCKTAKCPSSTTEMAGLSTSTGGNFKRDKRSMPIFYLSGRSRNKEASSGE